MHLTRTALAASTNVAQTGRVCLIQTYKQIKLCLSLYLIQILWTRMDLPQKRHNLNWISGMCQMMQIFNQFLKIFTYKTANFGGVCFHYITPHYFFRL